LSTLSQRRNTREVQYALSRLSAISSPQHIMSRYLDDLLSGKLVPQLRLDVLEAATSRAATNRNLKQRLNQHHEQVQRKGPLAQYDVALEGGDADIGKSIFLGKAEAACSKCHALSKTDKQVGPSLQGIAARQPRAYLLRSIIDPQAEVVAGYNVVTLTLDDLSSVTGTLMNETTDAITLKLPDGREKNFAKTEIESRTKPQSPMPDMTKVLSLTEIRDLVAYLASLR
ncbi:MAG: hypothetical protein QGF59_26925, partial [Pirellulaceae bacterium]|nr:hypothetical protein [Pirellulaceae bacterium]